MDNRHDVRRLAERMNGRLDNYLRDLAELVNIDSGSYDRTGVNQVVSFLDSAYRGLGAQTETVPGTDLGDILLARLAGTGSGKVLLVGHTDTVFGAGTAAARPFRIKGDRAYGPGVSDMKAGDLSIVYALGALLDEGFDNFARITVLHNPDEEIGSPSSHDLIEAESREADAVLVLEPGRETGNIVSARKGMVALDLNVRGVAAHAGVNKARGRSAAVELAHLVINLEALNGQLPDTTVNIGYVESGTRPNVVPELGRAHGESRAFRTEYLEEIVRRAQEIVARRTVEGTEAELIATFGHYPMERSSRSSDLVALAQRLSEQLGYRIEDEATGGASDGNTAARAGRPVLDGLGPVGGQAHSPLEYLEVPTIAPRTAVLGGLIAAIGSGQW